MKRIVLILLAGIGLASCSSTYKSYPIEYSPNDWNFLPFISCVGLMFVGTAPAFKDHELEKKVHTGAALICAISSYIWTILYTSLFLSINFILLSILLYFLLKKNKTYWIEMLAFINPYSQMLLAEL